MENETDVMALFREKFYEEPKPRAERIFHFPTIAENIAKIENAYLRNIEKSPSSKELQFFARYLNRNKIKGSEYFFCPETEYYPYLLEFARSSDIVFDAGAGDLRFDLMLCRKVKHVFAVEINPINVYESLRIMGYSKPANLTVICGNAFSFPLPSNISYILCLMIHRVHFPQSWEKARIIQTSTGGISLLRFLEPEKVRLRKIISKINKSKQNSVISNE
jgi:hypothetical protein